MAGAARVFLSSTSEFLDQREKLQEQLPDVFELFCYENVAARGQSPKAVCEEQIRNSNVFVGILGNEFGTELPGDTSGRSVVEWEFDTATAIPTLEKLVFVNTDASADHRQREFVDRVTSFEGGTWCQRFQSTSELVDHVTRSLIGWLSRRWQYLRQRQQEIPHWLAGRVTLVVAVALLVALACLSPFVQERVTTNAIIATLLASFITALCAVLLWKREMTQ